jgi:hypothetical protein
LFAVGDVDCEVEWHKSTAIWWVEGERGGGGTCDENFFDIPDVPVQRKRRKAEKDPKLNAALQDRVRPLSLPLFMRGASKNAHLRERQSVSRRKTADKFCAYLTNYFRVC